MYSLSLWTPQVGEVKVKSLLSSKLWPSAWTDTHEQLLSPPGDKTCMLWLLTEWEWKQPKVIVGDSMNNIPTHTPLVITACIRSTMGRLCFDTCLSVCPHGVYPYPIMLCNISQNAMGQTPRGGTLPGPAGGDTLQGGYPARGTLPGGTQVRYPPVRSGWGGYPVRTTEGVLTTQQVVCLLHSCRRTFLLIHSVTLMQRKWFLWELVTFNTSLWGKAWLMPGTYLGSPLEYLGITFHGSLDSLEVCDWSNPKKESCTPWKVGSLSSY